MLGYLSYVNITDGQHSVRLNKVKQIYIKSSNGQLVKVSLGYKPTSSNYYGYKGKVLAITGHKVYWGKRIVEENSYGKRAYKRGEYHIPYARNTWQSIDGVAWRRDMIGRDKGICYTESKRGKFIRQWFNYSKNGRKAYEFKRGANELKIVYPNGKLRYEFAGSKNIYDNNIRNCWACTAPHKDDDNYTLTEYNRKGIVRNQVNMVNRQINGEYIKEGIKYFYVNGLAVPKKLYDAKPEELNPRAVLRIDNAQVRGMMLKKVGLARIVKECKGKLIDRDESTGNELYDFVCSRDKEIDEIERYERVLKVVCTSTKAEYFLRIPYDEHFSTCEQARQGTFTGFDPDAKPIAFKLET